MFLGAHWAYWLALLLAISALVGDQVRRHRRRARRWLAAFLEQGRKEEEVENNPAMPNYRPDVRVKAIQQRLSRTIGAKAFNEKTREKILQELRNSGLHK